MKGGTHTKTRAKIQVRGKKCFIQTYRDFYGDAMLVLTRMSSNMADGNQQKHLLPSFCATKA